MLQDYTIDYEEYFNRGIVGCVNNNKWWDWYTWSTDDTGHCPLFTNYGNGIPFVNHYSYVADSRYHGLYACSSDLVVWQNAWPNTAGQPLDTSLIMWYDTIDGSLACVKEFHDFVSCGGWVCGASSHFYQPYGAYRMQFRDVKADVDDKFGRMGDDDDTDTGIGPDAVFDNTHVKELYLLSKDKKRRIILRRNLVASQDRNRNGTIEAWENLYSIEMLQLKAFDAGTLHDFDPVNPGVYDGIIDTWACNAEAGFTCSWLDMSSFVHAYAGYNLPDGPDDWRVSLTSNDVSVLDRNMIITPIKDPSYARWEPKEQRNPYITLWIKTGIYGENRVGKIGAPNAAVISYDLQTSFNIKTNY